MKLQSNERGELNVLLIPVIALSLLFIGALSFAIWAYGERQDYKTNSDQKSVAAVAANKKVVQAEDAKLYAEAAKQPLKVYQGPEAYGTVKISYPKTWSAYTDTTATSNSVDTYFHPNLVPSKGDVNSSFALRMQVVTQQYSAAIKQFANNKLVTVTAFSFKNVPNVVGIRVDGQIAQKKQGSMVIVPLRDKTIKIWTESNDFIGDFNNNILPNVTFSP